jgi:hypothetical protein
MSTKEPAAPSSNMLAAKLVGRWRCGTPLTPVFKITPIVTDAAARLLGGASDLAWAAVRCGAFPDRASGRAAIVGQRPRREGAVGSRSAYPWPPALLKAATETCASEIEMVAEHVQQRRIAIRSDPDRSSVYGEGKRSHGVFRRLKAAYGALLMQHSKLAWKRW